MRDRVSPDPDLPRVEAEVDALLAEALSELLPEQGLSRAARARLLGAAQSSALRYAPLFDQLGELWDLADPELERVFTAAADAKAWQRAWPGFRFLGVNGGAKLAGARARLLHFSPGARFPRHRHREAESILVLEGSYTDAGVLVVRAGERQDMSAGSEHELVIGSDRPCVAAVVERGLEFTGPVLKLLGRWFSL
jgi:anti-sigma factor ChrR (cupin superfamily)